MNTNGVIKDNKSRLYKNNTFNKDEKKLNMDKIRKINEI